MMAVLTENYGGKWYIGEKEGGGERKKMVCKRAGGRDKKVVYI